MRNSLKIASFILAVTMVTSSCDDFVEVAPIGETSANYFNSEAEYEKALIGAYDLLQATFWNVLTGVVASDDFIAGGDSSNLDQPTLQKVDKMTQSPSDNNQLRDIWSLMYAGINRSNYLLEFKDKTEFARKSNIIAQTYFLRAYFTFELAKFFGNIPLAIDESSGTKRILEKRVQFGDQFEINRVGSIAEVYSLIEEDLKAAIPNLPVNQTENYEITKGAAQALLGKVYLYHAKFDASKFTDAADQFENVIISGKYELLQGAEYQDFFESGHQNSLESVFEVQYTGVEGASWDCLVCSEGSYFVQFNGPRSPYSDTTFGTGWGFNLPTQNLVDAFDAGDLRKDVTIYDLTGNTSYSESRENTGYFNRKYISRKADPRVGSDPLNHENNYRAIRYADVLLMAAEANLSKSPQDVSKAQGYLDQVRDRAFGNTTNRVTATEETIFAERRLELAGEGHRFFDLVRTGRAKVAFDTYNTNKPAEFGEISFDEDKNEIFPIPLVELELANAITRWGQNPGY
jgi:hypothetical protein